MYVYNGVVVLMIFKDFGWVEIEDNFEMNVSVYIVNYFVLIVELVVDVVKLIKVVKLLMIYFGVGVKDVVEELKVVFEKFKMLFVFLVLVKGIIEDDYFVYLGFMGWVVFKLGVEIGFSMDLIFWVGNNVLFSIFLFNKKVKVI